MSIIPFPLIVLGCSLVVWPRRSDLQGWVSSAAWLLYVYRGKGRPTSRPSSTTFPWYTARQVASLSGHQLMIDKSRHTGDKELRLVETLKILRSLFLVWQQRIACLDRPSISYLHQSHYPTGPSLASLYWEFGPQFHYSKDLDNVRADALSLGFPYWRGSVQQCTWLTKLSQWIQPLLATSRFAMTHAYWNASSTILLTPMSYRFPSSNCFSIIHKLDQELQTIRLADPHRYPMVNPGNCNLIVYVSDPGAAWHIVKPDQ
jgi:hypothetical protein